MTGRSIPPQWWGLSPARLLRARFCEGVDVITVHSSPIGVHVLTERDEFSAEIVILATNAYTAQIALAGPENAAEVLPPLVQPRRAQMLGTAPIARPLCDLPTYSHFGYRYWRQSAGRRDPNRRVA